MRDDGSCDLSIVEEILGKSPDGYSAVIKSTVVPGTTQDFANRFRNLKIAYMPEFLVERRHLEDFANQDFLVCGTHHRELAESVFEHHRKANVLKSDITFHVFSHYCRISKIFKKYFLCSESDFC